MDRLLDELRTELNKERVLIVVGAGVSRATTRGNPLATWKGLLEQGVCFCAQSGQQLREGWAEAMLSRIRDGDLLEMIGVADEISKRLGYPDGGDYRRWLRDTVGSLQAQDPALIQALAALDSPFATTNYDSLLTQVTRLRPVPWTDRALAQRWQRNDEQGVLHLHGYWDEPRSVVLGISSYDGILRDAHTQTLVRSCLAGRTLLFVGFGAGLEDPNFTALRDWSREVFAQSEYSHFRLDLERNVEQLRRMHAGERMKVLSYGKEHEDLIPFLRGLAGGRTGQRTASPVVGGLLAAQRVADGRADLDRRKAALDARRTELTATDYLRELRAICSVLWEAGGRRSAWMLLESEFSPVAATLSPGDRLAVGLQIVRMMLEDGMASTAGPLLQFLLTDAQRLPADHPNVLSYWRLAARGWADLCAYAYAVEAISRAVSLAPAADLREELRAELAELHLLQGEVAKADAAASMSEGVP